MFQRIKFWPLQSRSEDLGIHSCYKPTLREVWGHHSHSQKWDLGVLRDSWKLKTQLQRSKHLTLRCSLYRWKGLEVLMSKKALHEPFQHLQHKLWSKEGPGVKLAIWLLTLKCWESTWPWCVQVECNTPLESSQGELQVWLNFVPIGGWSEKLWMPKVSKL
jgi:hypothetical protein